MHGMGHIIPTMQSMRWQPTIKRYRLQRVLQKRQHSSSGAYKGPMPCNQYGSDQHRLQWPWGIHLVRRLISLWSCGMPATLFNASCRMLRWLHALVIYTCSGIHRSIVLMCRCILHKDSGAMWTKSWINTVAGKRGTTLFPYGGID